MVSTASQRRGIGMWCSSLATLLAPKILCTAANLAAPCSAPKYGAKIQPRTHFLRKNLQAPHGAPLLMEVLYPLLEFRRPEYSWLAPTLLARAELLAALSNVPKPAPSPSSTGLDWLLSGPLSPGCTLVPPDLWSVAQLSSWSFSLSLEAAQGRSRFSRASSLPQVSRFFSVVSRPGSPSCMARLPRLLLSASSCAPKPQFCSAWSSPCTPVRSRNVLLPRLASLRLQEAKSGLTTKPFLWMSQKSKVLTMVNLLMWHKSCEFWVHYPGTNCMWARRACMASVENMSAM